MAHERQVTIGDIDFYVFAKSVQVCTPDGYEWVFYGKKVEDRDLRALCRLIEIGGRLRMDRVQKALNATTLFDHDNISDVGTTTSLSGGLTVRDDEESD